MDLGHLAIDAFDPHLVEPGERRRPDRPASDESSSARRHLESRTEPTDSCRLLVNRELTGSNELSHRSRCFGALACSRLTTRRRSRQQNSLNGDRLGAT